MRSGRSLHASNSDCNFVQSGTYCRPFRKLDGDEPAVEKSERRRVGVKIQIVLLLMGIEPMSGHHKRLLALCFQPPKAYPKDGTHVKTGHRSGPSSRMPSPAAPRDRMAAWRWGAD